jgi:hypothetical protein
VPPSREGVNFMLEDDKAIILLLLIFGGMLLGSCKKNSDSSSVLQVQMQATIKSFSVLKTATVVPSFTWCVYNERLPHQI